MKTVYETVDDIAPKVATLRLHRATCSRDDNYGLQVCTEVEQLRAGAVLHFVLQSYIFADADDLKFLTHNEIEATCSLDWTSGMTSGFKAKVRPNSFKMISVTGRDGRTRMYPSAEIVVVALLDDAALPRELEQINLKRSKLGHPEFEGRIE